MFIAHGSRIRKYSPWIMAAVLVVLLPSFVFFFAPGSGPGSGQSLTIPTIQGKEAPVAEYMKAYKAVVTETKFRFGNRQEVVSQLRPQIQQLAAQRMLLWREAEKLGIVASIAEVRKQIEATPNFQDESGKYDYYRYTGFLAGRGIKEAEYGEYLLGQLVIERLFETITKGVVLSPSQVRQEYDASNEKYRIELVHFKAEDFKSKVTISDGDAQKHFEENKEQFKTEAKVKVRHALFAFDAAQKNVNVTEDDLKKYFEQNASAYTKEDGKPKTFEEAKTQVQDVLVRLKARQLAGNNAMEFTVALKPESGEPPDFAALAAKLGAVVRETPYFGLTNTVEGVQAGQTFNRASHALLPEYPTSDEIEGVDGFYVVQLIDKKPSQPATFEEVKARIVDLLASQKSLQEARTAAGAANQKFKDGLAAGKTFTQIAESNTLTVIKPEPFSVNEGGADLPNASLIKSVARRTPRGSISDTIYTSNGAVVFQLIERTPPTEEQFLKDKESFSTLLSGRARQDAWVRWETSLMKDGQVSFGNEP